MWSLDELQWLCIRTAVNTSLYIRRSPYLSPETQPNYTKLYPCRPHLYATRIFLPASHDGQSPLPLVIRAHGGGFVVNNPSMDDPLARRLADNAFCCVVSIDYGKAPQSKFPTGYEDIVAQALAIIDDDALPIDRDRVFLSGTSAGGNLMLAAAQDKRLRGKVGAVSAIYPLVDVTENGAMKMATRPDPTVPDFIGAATYDGIEKLYLSASQRPDKKDVRLSPTFFATRESLPSHVLLVGAEHDMFCREAEVMAEKVAASDAREKVKIEAGWRAEHVWWHLIKGQPHAFDAFPVKDEERERDRVERVAEMYGLLCDWVTEISRDAHPVG